METEEHNISQFDDDASSHFLTRSDYQYATELDQYEEHDYQMSMPEVCQEMPQKSYGLRSGVKHAAQTKKVVKAFPLKQNLPANPKQIVNQRKNEVVNPEEMTKSVSGFSFEHELNKVKIPVPLTELIKSKVYREAAFKTFRNVVNSTPITSDEINLQDEKPTIIVGSKTFDQPDDNSEYPPPFYITFFNT